MTILAAQSVRISASRIRAHVKYLASDRLQGRGVGTEGGRLATECIASQLQAEGVPPGGDNGTYFQAVPLVGCTVRPSATLAFEGPHGTVRLHRVSDYVGIPLTQKSENNFDAEAVFVGHGISAPQYHWDDYKGTGGTDMGLRGKVLVYFTNEPPSNDPAFFAGPSLTYYGRWTYKFEEAARRGAVAALIIHTTPTAGYGWNVVSGSWGREQSQLKLPPGQHGLKLAAWLTEQAGAKLVAATGKTIPQLLAMSNRRNFHPIPLGVRVVGHIPIKLRQIESRNVIGRIAGADPQLKKQAVVFTAHWDHLGIGIPVSGDDIYNGAVDNATGCGMLLEMARQWEALPVKPKRSALFIFVTAEEAGLLGSEYYSKHPEIPAGRTAADLNFDAFYPFGRTRNVSLIGAERTTLWPLVQRDAKRLGLSIEPDPEPGQGSYYRSDHFSFARVGIPAFSVEQGTDYIGKPANFGKTVFQQYNTEHYHQPSDEYHTNWDFAGIVQMADFGFTLGLDIADIPRLPTWHAGDEFLVARQRSGVH